jgi:hypothetical protein
MRRKTITILPCAALSADLCDLPPVLWSRRCESRINP